MRSFVLIVNVLNVGHKNLWQNMHCTFIFLSIWQIFKIHIYYWLDCICIHAVLFITDFDFLEINWGKCNRKLTWTQSAFKFQQLIEIKFSKIPDFRLNNQIITNHDIRVFSVMNYLRIHSSCSQSWYLRCPHYWKVGCMLFFLFYEIVR